MTITAAVDGSSLGNPGPAGWAWVVDSERWDAGGWPEGTNNLGELTAVLELLKATQAAGLGGEELHILADSQYAINVVSKWRHGWKKRGWAKADKKPIKNLELIQEIDRIIEGRAVTFEWVKGHAGHEMNERADDLARGCAEAYRQGRIPERGPAFSGASVCAARTSESAQTPRAQESGATAPSPDASPARRGLSAGADAPGASPDPAAPVDPLPITELEKRFIRAWASHDLDALDRLAADECLRVWPDGRSTPTLAGPVPPGLSVSRFETAAAGDSTIVRYSLRWEGGASAESSVWAPDPKRGRVLVHHQSTILS